MSALPQISIPSFQVHGALSGGVGDLRQQELKTPTDRSRSDCVHEQEAKRIANVRFTSYLYQIKSHASERLSFGDVAFFANSGVKLSEEFALKSQNHKTGQ